MSNPEKPPPRDALGVILADATYPLPEFQKLTGLGEAALRKARRQGLTVTTIGRRRFVRGADFHEFIGARASAAHARHTAR
jgi:hypothetical protein